MGAQRSAGLDRQARHRGRAARGRTLSSTPRATILVVEADRRLGERIAEQLLDDGYTAALALSAEHARVLARACPPALVLLGGLDEPGGGLGLLREIRTSDASQACWEHSPAALVLGAGSGELELLRAFEAGADDFVLHRAPYLELRARVAALLRRASLPAMRARRLIRVEELLIDTMARVASMDCVELELRRMEFELLLHLARDPARVYARDELLREVWGYRCAVRSRTVDSHASRLRRKLDPHRSGRWVTSVRGVGYRLT